MDHALLHALLRGKGLTRTVTVPVSAGLLTDVDAYFASLDAYRAGEPAVIVELLANASFRAIGNSRTLVGELHRVRESWNERVRARRDARTWRIADLVLRHPVVDAPLLARELGIPASNVYRSLAPLLEADVLKEASDRRRKRTWRSNEVIAPLDALAARAGRRMAPQGT